MGSFSRVLYSSPGDLQSCGHRHVSLGASGQSTLRSDPTEILSSHHQFWEGGDSCLESFVQREKHTRPKAVFLRCFAIANSSEKGQQEWERAMPSGQGSGFACLATIFVRLSPLTPNSCTPVISLHPSSTANSPLLPPVPLTLDSLTIQAFNLRSVLTLF